MDVSKPLGAKKKIKKKTARKKKQSTPKLPSVRGLPNIGTIITVDSTSYKSLIPEGPVKTPMPVVPQCGDWQCLNGPPVRTDPLTAVTTVFQTYALCDKCVKGAIDPYIYGHAVMPPEWSKPKRSAADRAVEAKKRRLKAIAVLSSQAYGNCIALYPGVFGQKSE